MVRVRREKQEAFLKFYGTYGTMALACHEVGLREERISHWRHADPIFDKKVAAAEKMVGDRLVKEVIHRAVEGEERGIYNKQGELVDTVYEKSDSLLMFATKRHRPEYRDRVDPAVIAPTINIQNNTLVKIDPSRLAPEQLEIYEQLLLAATAPDDPSGGGAPALLGPQGAPPAPIPPVR